MFKSKCIIFIYIIASVPINRYRPRRIDHHLICSLTFHGLISFVIIVIGIGLILIVDTENYIRVIAEYAIILAFLTMLAIPAMAFIYWSIYFHPSPPFSSSANCSFVIVFIFL